MAYLSRASARYHQACGLSRMTCGTTVGCVTNHQRWATQLLSKERDTSGKGANAATVVYEGGMAASLQRVKLLSLSSCICSLVEARAMFLPGGPVLTFLTAPELPVITKGAMASTMILFSASTTAALHWLARPYVCKLTWAPGSKEMEVEMFSWMATPLRRTILLSDVKRPDSDRPAVTFMANGEYYFIDKATFPHGELLKKLTLG